MSLTDYKRIEYIEAQKLGGVCSYIDTGIKPTRFYTLYGTFAFNISSITDNTYLFGVYDGTRNYSLYYSYADTEYRFRYATRSATTFTPTNTFFNDTEIIDAGFAISIAENSCEGFIMDHDEYASPFIELDASTTIPGSAATSTKNLYLLCRNGNGTAGGFATGSRCYEFNVIDVNTDTVIAHFFPVREKSGLTPKVGLYDIIRDAVFWSYTTTNFIAGPDLSAANVYVKSGGSWHSGTGYIKVSGSWEEASDVYIKANGSWESSV